jgi:hypothetical protein
VLRRKKKVRASNEFRMSFNPNPMEDTEGLLTKNFEQAPEVKKKKKRRAIAN